MAAIKKQFDMFGGTEKGAEDDIFHLKRERFGNIASMVIDE